MKGLILGISFKFGFKMFLINMKEYFKSEKIVLNMCVDPDKIQTLLKKEQLHGLYSSIWSEKEKMSSSTKIKAIWKDIN